MVVLLLSDPPAGNDEQILINQKIKTLINGVIKEADYRS